LQALPDIVQICHLDSKMMDTAAASIPRRLIIDIETPGPYGEEYISCTRQFPVEVYPSAQMTAPPVDRRVDIARKHVRMM
jgi:hypothetical protein